MRKLDVEFATHTSSLRTDARLPIEVVIAAQLLTAASVARIVTDCARGGAKRRAQKERTAGAVRP
jgi:hypothetical protein